MDIHFQRVVLTDGRRLGFDEYGPPDGCPILYFHGTSSSRKDWAALGNAGLPEKLGVRILSADRPGMGLSSFQPGRLDTLLGSHLDEVPETYAQASPVSHVQTGCPPTLLIQGETDIIMPAAAMRDMQRRLVDNCVPSVNIIYPLTNHAFDLLWPKVSPVAGIALYDLERFLALVA